MKHAKLFLPALPLALLLSSADAGATHKSWLLQDSGASCQSVASSRDADIHYLTGSVFNTSATPRSVVCPVTLGGRFGATSTPVYGSFPMTESMRARDGDVFVYDGNAGADISCHAYAVAQTGAGYYSRTVSSAATGAQTLHVFDTPNLTWAGTMTNLDLNIRSLGYRCYLPQSSYVYGYMVNLCQIHSQNCST